MTSSHVTLSSTTELKAVVFGSTSVMPKGEGIAQKPPPEILDELIPPPPRTEAEKIYLEEKFDFST